ncbi:MAG TPA: phage holin family protein [Verrucomicrobiales bacterium]|jgi:putative membrane protein|nr:phage holin family protein [Verrucomicrobiales bacterium]
MIQFNANAEPKEKRPMRDFLHQFVVGTLAVLVAVHLVPEIKYEKPVDLLLATLVLGFLNGFLRPLLLLGCLPLLILTLGMFLIVINAGLLMLTAEFVDGFSVKWFWPAFWGALIISIVTLIVNTLTGGGRSKFQFLRGRQKEKKTGYDHDDDDGPVIDV